MSVRPEPSTELPRLPPRAWRHERMLWTPEDPPLILAHGRNNQMRGTFRVSAKEALRNEALYLRAKTAGDMQAAVQIVQRCVRDDVIDRIIDRLERTDREPLIVIPHPEFDSGLPQQVQSALPANALPFAYANYLATVLDCEVDEAIYEVARPGRTRLKACERFVWQPKFMGTVRHDRAYIMVDDVCTLGGTMAMLRSHIVANGGTVIAASTLARTDGEHSRFPILPLTLHKLATSFGPELNAFWIEEIGHEIQCLTDPEGQYLQGWFEENCERCGGGVAAIHRLRDALATGTARQC